MTREPLCKWHTCLIIKLYNKVHVCFTRNKNNCEWNENGWVWSFYWRCFTIRPYICCDTLTKISKVIGIPLDYGLEKSILILIDKYEKLLVENKKIKDLELHIPNQVETNQIAKSGVPYNA